MTNLSTSDCRQKASRVCLSMPFVISLIKLSYEISWKCLLLEGKAGLPIHRRSAARALKKSFRTKLARTRTKIVLVLAFSSMSLSSITADAHPMAQLQLFLVAARQPPKWIFRLCCSCRSRRLHSNQLVLIVNKTASSSNDNHYYSSDCNNRWKRWWSVSSRN